MPCGTKGKKGNPIQGVAFANGKGGYIAYKHKKAKDSKWRAKAAKMRS